MRKVKVSGFLFGIVMLFAAPASWGVVVELEEPPALAIPAGYTGIATVQAIKFAMQPQKWTLIAEEQGKITAELVVRGSQHVIVSVLYDEQFVRIKYLDSRNMYYQMGIPYSDDEVDEWSATVYKKPPLIHYRYNAWVQTFSNNIERALHTAGLN